MNVAVAPSVPALLAGNAVGEADRPLLTYYDDATGERTELTATELGGWAARTAGSLREGCGLGLGSRAAVLLPPRWQTAAVLLGAWSIGVEVSFRPAAAAGLPVLEAGTGVPAGPGCGCRDGRRHHLSGVGDPGAGRGRVDGGPPW